MGREKKQKVAEVGRVKLTYDLNRIEADVRIQITDLNGNSWEGQAPVVDLIRAMAIMGGEYMEDVRKTLQPYFDENSCRHNRYEDTPWCAEMSCHNYAGKRDKAPGLESFEPAKRRAYWSDEVPEKSVRRLGLSPEEEAEGE